MVKKRKNIKEREAYRALEENDDNDFCREPIDVDDSMKIFSCEK